MANYIVTDTELTSIANSIRTKGGTNELLSFPEEFINAIENISTGSSSQGGAVTAKEVNFRDYDGTIIYSYTPTEFAALTAMPANPDHSGDAIPLTSQGWNWSFADAQAYVAEYGQLEVGQMYATTDGKTHVLIHLAQGRTSPLLGVCPNGTVDVDWGDGTAHDTLTGTSVTTVKWTSTHNYATPGDYDIKLTCTGTMGFWGYNASNQYSDLLRYSTNADGRNQIYQNAIQAIYCADSVTSIVNYAFYNCCNLSTITIPSTVTGIGTSVFYNCYALSSITIPTNVKSISNSAFSNCYSLSNITIPNTVTSIGNGTFSSCYNLSSITISGNITSINANAFNSCQGLSSITIPNTVKSIGTNAFASCFALSTITISSGVKSIADSVFSNCYSLSSIIIPNTVTSIGSSVFYNCFSLSSITIPNTVTSIGTSAFAYCHKLSNITISNSVSRIGTSTFYECYGLAELHFLSATPPTVPNPNAFSNVPTDCKIFVPAGSLNTYTTATNYPSSSTYTYIEE